MTMRAASILLSALAGVTVAAAQPARHPIPPAFGPHVSLTAKDFAESRSFTSHDRLVGTYYFYWYDCYTGAHIRDADGTDALTTHPPTLEDFSYKSVRWHRQQLLDMEAAGIDVALPVFWGSPAEHSTGTALHWSFAGLPPLVQARDELLRQGRRPPALGLFYDTSTLRHNHWGYHADLTTDYGKQFFYGTVRDFFSCIPPRHWALLDGRPIVLLYAAAFASKWDQGFIEYTKAQFAREFGGRVPWIAPQDSWRVRGDSTCAWGGALAFRNPGIGELGPGYDHSAVPGRAPLVRDREGGKFYEESWLKFLRRPTPMVMVETWNEFHEGTDVAESREYGRRYIELTRKYADLFKKGWQPPWPKGSFHQASAVTAAPGLPEARGGLRLVQPEDGQVGLAQTAARHAWQPQPFRGAGHSYLYFAVDDSFKRVGSMNVTVQVEYFDAAPGRLGVEFDGSDAAAPFHGAYSRSDKVPLTGDQRWKSADFALDAARFLNSQNGGADFRLVVEAPAFAVGKVTLKRR